MSHGKEETCSNKKYLSSNSSTTPSAIRAHWTVLFMALHRLRQQQVIHGPTITTTTRGTETSTTQMPSGQPISIHTNFTTTNTSKCSRAPPLVTLVIMDTMRTAGARTPRHPHLHRLQEAARTKLPKTTAAVRTSRQTGDSQSQQSLERAPRPTLASISTPPPPPPQRHQQQRPTRAPRSFTPGCKSNGSRGRPRTSPPSTGATTMSTAGWPTRPPPRRSAAHPACFPPGPRLLEGSRRPATPLVTC